jgi:hypothetical protein
VEDLGRNGSNQQAAEKAASIGRHHDQIHLVGVSELDDLPGRISQGRNAFHSNTGKLFGQGAVETRLKILLHPFRIRNIRNGANHTDERDPCAESFRGSPDEICRLEPWRREIEWKKDVCGGHDVLPK